jgi:glutamine amidotransferase
VIVILDAGLGNVGSILNMLKKIGAPARVSSSLDDIGAAKKLILPGVGAFDTGMTQLERSGFLDLLHRRVLEDKVPVLGVCLGMQLLGKRSEEGVLPGLGWLDAESIRFVAPPGDRIKIPHMGWNTVTAREGATLFRNADVESRYYFVHSYHVVVAEEKDAAATGFHGVRFNAAVERGNIYGTQFHPEKSHRFGLQVFKNFVDLA